MLEAEGARERAEQREAAETRLRVRAEEERLAARRGGDGGPGLQTIIYPEQIDDLLAAGMARDADETTNEAKLLQVERARHQRDVEMLFTPLLESERHRLAGPHAHAPIPRYLERVPLGGRKVVGGGGHARGEMRRRLAAEQRRRDEEAFMEAALLDQQVREGMRQHTMRVREEEMAQLEARLTEAFGKRSGAPGGADIVDAEGGGEGGPEEELLHEESISSVVQHLSSFGLNRNLPWQIYATRAKRFPRPLASTQEEAIDAQQQQLQMLSASDPHAMPDGQWWPPHADGLYEPVISGDDGAAYHDGDCAVPSRAAPQRAILRSVYDKSARPHGHGRVSPGRQRKSRGPVDPLDGYGLPPIRGAEPLPPRLSMAKGAWLSPRSVAQSGTAMRARAATFSPRVMHAQGAYYPY